MCKPNPLSTRKLLAAQRSFGGAIGELEQSPHDRAMQSAPTTSSTQGNGSLTNQRAEHPAGSNGSCQFAPYYFPPRMLVPPYEPRLISDRTRAALAASKARGKRLGGFRGRAGTAADCAKARRAKSLAVKSRAADLAPVSEDIRTAGANSLRPIAKELNGRGIFFRHVAQQVG